MVIKDSSGYYEKSAREWQDLANNSIREEDFSKGQVQATLALSDSMLAVAAALQEGFAKLGNLNKQIPQKPK
jgi:hypothetical protein